MRLRNNRYIRTLAVKTTREGELIPLFLLKPTNNYMDCLEFEDEEGKIYNINADYVEVNYDLWEKKVVSPGTRIVKIFDENIENYDVGDKVCVEIGSYKVSIDTIKEIIPTGESYCIDYVEPEEIKIIPEKLIISDEGDKSEGKVRLERYNAKFIMESGRVEEKWFKIHKIIS